MRLVVGQRLTLKYDGQGFVPSEPVEVEAGEEVVVEVVSITSATPEETRRQEKWARVMKTMGMWKSHGVTGDPDEPSGPF